MHSFRIKIQSRARSNKFINVNFINVNLVVHAIRKLNYFYFTVRANVI